MRAVLQSSGQNCAGAERFYVHKDIYSSFINQVSKIVKSVSAVSMSLSTKLARLKSVSAIIQFVLDTFI